MPDTIVHTAGDVVDGTVTGLATAVGSLTNEAAHHAETLAEHTGRLTNIESDTQWIRSRLESLEATALQAPDSAMAEIREQISELRNDVAALTANLAEETEPQTVDPPQTDPPPPAANEAQERQREGPLGGLRRALHRLL